MARTEEATGSRAVRARLVLAIALAVSLLLAVAFSPARVLAQNGQADDADHRTGSTAPTFEAPQNLPRYAPDRVIVGLEKGVGEDALEAPKDETSARERFEINDGRVEVLTLPESSGTSALEAVEVFSESPGIAYAERDAVLVATDMTLPNDAWFGYLWGLHNTGQFYGSVADADTDAPEAWTVNKGGGVVVGVIDTGVDASHPDLTDNMWTNPGEVPGNGVDDDANGYVDDIHGWDFFNNDASVFDEGENAHGTHVAGTIAATANNGVGVAGIAPEAKVASLKFLNSQGIGSSSNAARAVDYAVAEGIRVTNNSYGAAGTVSVTLQDAVERADAAGHLFVASAGNGGTDTVGDDNDVTPTFPASMPVPNVMSVAATDKADAMGGFSNYGATHVDLGAPGISIYSTLPNGTYGPSTGTSMASPHVAGAAALLYSKQAGTEAGVGSETDTQIKGRLMSTVDVVPSLEGKTVSNGRLNAAAAVGYEEPPVDATPPDTSVDSGPSGVVGSASAVFGFSSSEAGSTFGCSLDGGAYGSCSPPKDYAALSDGSHTFRVKATDAAGNTDATPASRSWTVDTQAPEAPVIGSPTNNSYNATGNVTVTGTAEPFSTVSIVDGTASMGTTQEANASGDWSKALTSVPEGSHTYTARATDAAGNTSVVSNARVVIVDTVSPQTSIDSGPSNTTATISTRFTFSSEDGADFQCSLDGADYETCTSPKKFTNVTTGSHTFQVRATDAAGNIDPTPASRTWTVDTTLPNTTIDSGPSGVVNATSANFNFSSEGSSFVCSLDGSAYSECHSPRSYSGLSNGTHTFRVKATDVAGNGTPAERPWTVDTAAPEGTVLINGGRAVTAKPSVNLALRASDPSSGSSVSSMRVKNAGGNWSAWQPYVTTKSWRLGAGAGMKTVYAQFRDPAGNFSAIVLDTIKYRPS